ncbi:MAG: peptidase domain-containing ABC transporter [Gemmatimonadaceae bacterium]
MFRRIPTVRQHDQSDCGAACLASIAQWHGLRVPVARVRQHAHTDSRGTTALGLTWAATRLGFSAKGVRCTREALSTVPLPAIAHVVRDRHQHWIVVARADANTVAIMDPATGMRSRVTRANFEKEWTGVVVLLVPAARLEATARASVMRRFFSLLAPHCGILALAFVGAAVHTALGLSTSLYVQQLVDHVLVDGNRNLLNLMSITMIVLLLAQAIIGAMKGLLVLHTGQRLDAHLILGYHTHLLGLPQRFFDTMRVGEITSRVGDAVKIRALINDVALELVISALVVVLSLTLLFVYSTVLGALVAGIVPVYAAIWAAANARNRRVSRDIMERAAELESQLVESVGTMGTIKRFGLESVAALRTEVRFVRLLRAVFRAARTSLLTTTSTGLVSRLAVVTLLWSGATLVIDRQLTPGQLMSCYALLGYLTGPLTTLVSANRTIQDALIAADRLFEIMDLEREEAAAHTRIQTARAGDVALERVTFRYGARAPVLRDVSVRMVRGAVTAIVGESGSGKSTIAALVQRMRAVEEGHIRIGGIDVRHLSDETMRELVCAVPQRIDLFAGTVIDNIALGHDEPDLERAIDAARSAGFLEVVERLPSTFDTEIGENGAMLSGGERQRLAIARALYRDPEILILDEATSSLDATCVCRVQQMIRERRARGRTVIMIAHHLDMVAEADHIAVLRGGRVVEQGTHAELVRSEGLYRSMCEAGAVARVA